VLASALLISVLSEAAFVNLQHAAPPALMLRGGAFAHARQHHTLKVAANEDAQSSADSIEQAAIKATRIGSVRNAAPSNCTVRHLASIVQQTQC
jgi:hypothetical protein